MIRALRLLSRLAVIGAVVLVIAFYFTDSVDPPPQIQTSIEGEIDHILIEKTARKMTLYQNGQPVRVYSVALGFTPAGDKIREDDGKTPEGW